MGVMKVDQTDGDVNLSVVSNDFEKCAPGLKSMAEAKKRNLDEQGYIPLGFSTNHNSETHWIFSKYQHAIRGLSTTSLDKKSTFYAAVGPEYCQEYFSEVVTKKDDIVMIFDIEKARDEIITACNRAGRWEPDGRVRGAGVWSDDRGGLIINAAGRDLHRIDANGACSASSRFIDGFIYESTQNGFWSEDAATSKEINYIIETVTTQWKWREGLEGFLFAGWLLSQAYLGAGPVRPGVMMTGEAECGKSALQVWSKKLMGTWAIRFKDMKSASVIGTAQTIGRDALTFFFDEAQPEVGASQDEVMRFNRDLNRIKQMLRSAYRSDSDGQTIGSARGTVSGTPIFRDVNISAMWCATDMNNNDAADAGRNLHLGLLMIDRDENDRPIHAEPAAPIDGLGSRMYRLMWSRWTDFQKSFESITDLLTHRSSRMRTTLASPIAAIATARGISIDHSDIKNLIDDVNRYYVEGGEDTFIPDHEKALARLLATPLDLRNGHRIAVGEAITDALKNGMGKRGRGSGGQEGNSLRMVGITAAVGSDGYVMIFVANNKHPGIETLGNRIGYTNISNVLSKSPSAIIAAGQNRVSLGAGTPWGGVWVKTSIRLDDENTIVESPEMPAVATDAPF